MGRHIVTGPEVGHWVMNQTGGGYHAERSEAIGLHDGEKLVCGTVYENWNQRSIVCHIVFHAQMTKKYLAAIFHYPFMVCDVDKIIAPITSDNSKAVRLVKKMGFSEEARIKDAAPTGDIVIFTLARESCRFLGDRYGKILPQTARYA
jgi:RimJ/RimL family protein N-acetyltransferase